LNFLDRFSKKNQISNFTKIRPVEAELFHADGRTDMTKLIVAFPYFANAPKTAPYSTVALFIAVAVEARNWPLKKTSRRM
jgi:hypothetical protein